MLKRLANQYLLLITYYFRTAALRLSNQNPSPPKEKLDKIGQPSLVLGLGLLIFRSWQAKRAWLLSINSVLFSISGSFCQGCPILYSFIGAPAPLLPLLSSPESMLIQPDLISLPFNSLSIVLWQQACF
jgi:hypothetical protein